MATTVRRPISIFLAVALLLVAALPISAASPVRVLDAAAPGGRLIVVWRGAAPSRIAVAGIDQVVPAGIAQRNVVVASAGQAAAVARALRADPRVLAVVPDAQIKTYDWPADGAPNDPRFSRQRDLDQINVPESWPTTTGDPGVVVAVIDTGVDLTHPDLAGLSVVAPRNEIWNNTDVRDGVGHGTHVAGTIFAQTNNAVGIAGIAPTSSLMPIKVFDDTGYGSFSDVLDAIDWARTHGADIINLSIGGTLYPDQVALMQPTFTAARAAGILVVAAAGNSGMSLIEYPAAFQGVVSVGAVDGGDGLADFSAFNRAVDLTAPGVQTMSLLDGDYGRASGTSMASPHVAGGAALVLSARPGLSVAELETVLRISARDLGDPGRDNRFGSGRLDVVAALGVPVPNPLPNLEHAPGITDPLVVTFTSPTESVTQTKRTVRVAWTTSHAVLDGFLVRESWTLVRGNCPDEFEFPSEFDFLPLVSPTIETGLTAGACHRWTVIALDEEGQISNAISATVRILDTTAPRITSRIPVRYATGFARNASIKMTFSEPVRGVSSATLRLKSVRTGLWVQSSVSYSEDKRTATIDPVRTLHTFERYTVHVLAGITDMSGNKLVPTSWSFRTRH